MRILYLHQYFNTPRDASGTRSYEMARRLVASGHTVHMITSDRAPVAGRPPGWRISQEAGITVHWLPVPYANRMSYRQRVEAFLRFAFRSAARAMSIPADVVFATSTPLTIAIPAVAAARRQRIPMVFEVRDLWPELPIAVGALRDPVTKALARALEWGAYRAAAHIVALSPGMAEGVMRRGVPASRVTVIPNSCDVELFDVPSERGNAIRERLGLTAEQPLIVYAGSFGLINGVGYLVDLAAATRNLAPEVGFLLLGRGAELDRVKKRARELGVLERTLWIWDPVPKAQMPDVLAAATVATSVVIPLEALWHNSANKFFDALAARKAVMINHEGWQADVLRESGAGIVVPPDDVEAAARLLVDFVRDGSRLREASQAAGHLAHRVFHRDLLYAHLENILCRVVRDRDPGCER